MTELTDLLRSGRAGNAEAYGKLFELVYADLKRLAHSRLYQSGGPAELNTTSLVHESFVRLVERGQLQAGDRAAFFGYIGRVMRSVLIDHVRERQALKRGGEDQIITLTTGVQGEALDDSRLLSINGALDALEHLSPGYHQLIELRYFAGLSVREVAQLRGISTRSVEREWEKARAFLHQLMEEA